MTDQQAIDVVMNLYDTTPNKYRYKVRDHGAALSDVSLARGALGEEPPATIEVSVPSFERLTHRS